MKKIVIWLLVFMTSFVAASQSYTSIDGRRVFGPVATATAFATTPTTCGTVGGYQQLTTGIDTHGNATCLSMTSANLAPGYHSIVLASDSDITLTSSQYTGQFLKVTSSVSLTATRNVVVPVNTGQVYLVINATTGGQSIRIIGATGTGVVVPNDSYPHTVVCDGTNYVALASAGNFTLGTTSISLGVTQTSVVGLTIDGVTPTTMGFVDPTSSVQTQLNGKQATLTNPVTGPGGSSVVSGHFSAMGNTSGTVITDSGYSASSFDAFGAAAARAATETCTTGQYMKSTSTAGSGDCAQVSTSQISGLTQIVFNVKDYGATGNGSTDDAPYVRTAVAALQSAGGGTLYFPPGTYYLNSSDTYYSSTNKTNVNINSDNVQVKCAPGAKLTQPSSSNLTMFMFGLYGDGTHGFINYSSGYQANTLSAEGSGTITLSTAGNASNFTAGDLIYILGGYGAESNGDGELNWVTSADSGTGILTLLHPTSKAYTGNNSNVGPASVVTVYDVNGNYYKNNSIEGCTATSYGDFTYFGTVVGIKMKDNVVNVPAAASRGMMFNSYSPLGNTEVSGNIYTMNHGGFLWQLADGFTETDIHDNTFTVIASGGSGGGGILNVSQGAVRTRVNHNNLYLTYPASGGTTGNVAAIELSVSYIADISNNNIHLWSGATNGPAAISTGLSNGTCIHCSITNNFITAYTASPASTGRPYAVSNYGGADVIQGNHIIGNGYGGISVNRGSVGFYTESLISNNYIEVSNLPQYSSGISLSGSGAQDGYVSVVGNYINDSGGDNVTSWGINWSDSVVGNISHNYINGSSIGINLGGSATPQLIGNQCVNVATTTGCGSFSVLPDMGSSGVVWRGTNAGSTSVATGAQIASEFTNYTNSGCYLTGTGNCATPSSPASVPGWLLYLGDGSEGASSCAGGCNLAGEHWYTSFTISSGTLCATSTLTIRATGTCTIAGTVSASYNSCVNAGITGVATNYGGAGGGGGYGASNGAAGSQSAPLVVGAAGTSGVAGGNGSTQTAQTQHWLLANAPTTTALIQSSAIWYGGSPGGLGQGNSTNARGGSLVVFDCQTINFTGTIDASGVNGAAGGTNIGGNGGGGGGIVILRSPNMTNSGTINVAGGSGGTIGTGTSTKGGNGGAGWSAVIPY